MRKDIYPIENYFEKENMESGKKQWEILMYFELLEDFFATKENTPEKETIRNILKLTVDPTAKKIDLKAAENLLLNMKDKEFFNVVVRWYIIKINYLYRMLNEIQKAIKKGKDKREIEWVRSELFTFLKGDFEREYENIIPETERFLGYKSYVKVTDRLSKNYIKHDRLAYNEEDLIHNIAALKEIKDRLVVFKENENSDPYTASIKEIFRQLRSYIHTDKHNIATYDTQWYQEDVEGSKKNIATILLNKISKN